MKRVSLAGLLVVALGTGTVQAASEVDLLLLGGNQNNFKKLSEDLASATSYKGLTPAEPLGITGFDVGIEVTDTSLQYTNAFDTACGGCGVDNLTIVKAHLHKGLPMGFDVGLVHSAVGTRDVALTGLELRYANIEGGVGMPAVATRITWSRLDGVDKLSLESKGIEVTVSKGFVMCTPYAGAGQNWVTSDPSAATGLKSEDFTQSKYYVGTNINFGLLNFALEIDNTGGAQTIGAKGGFRF